MSDFVTLKSNSDFRRLYNRGKAVTDPALVVYYSKNRAGICRIGITTSKKIGNAVERNRSRRLLKEAFRSVCPQVIPQYDIVIVARSKTKYVKSTRLAEIMLEIFRDQGMLAPEGELLRIGVHPAHRRRGVGGALMRCFLNEAAKRGCTEIFLEVRADNEGAIALYHMLGFEQVGIRRRFYRAPIEDALVMIKRLI